MAERWWRVEVDAAGKVVSCAAAEWCEENGSCVIYVRASSKRDAGREAWNEHCRRQQAQRNTRLRKEGKCVGCGRVSDRDGSRCTGCLARERSYKSRKRKKDRGEPVPPKPSRVEALAKGRERDRENAELALLLEVQEAWTANTARTFGQWLSARIARVRADEYQGAAE